MLRGRLVLPQGIFRGEIVFGRRLDRIAPSAASSADDHDGGPLILPGFIDVHVHGGGGGDTMDSADGVRTLATFHARHGSTTVLPTTITNPFERVLEALEGVREVVAACERRDASGPIHADVPGAHLEGPFISPLRLGAQPPHAVAPTEERVQAVLATGAVRLATIAPEVSGAQDAALRLARAGVRVSIGHTRASYEQCVEFIQHVTDAGGVVGFTHLYNAMGGLEGREPGTVGAALATRESWAELILDLHHVYPGSVRTAFAAKGRRMIFVTDAIRGAGLPEGATELGGQPVQVSGGAARLKDGTLAGSVLTLDVALRNAVSIGLPLEDASHALSAAPAAYLGLTDRGRLEEGLRADVVVLDRDLKVTAVFVAGQRVPLA